jgi:hypothetical protein
MQPETAELTLLMNLPRCSAKIARNASKTAAGIRSILQGLAPYLVE